jgi:hypothetical protein
VIEMIDKHIIIVYDRKRGRGNTMKKPQRKNVDITDKNWANVGTLAAREKKSKKQVLNEALEVYFELKEKGLIL